MSSSSKPTNHCHVYTWEKIIQTNTYRLSLFPPGALKSSNRFPQLVAVLVAFQLPAFVHLRLGLAHGSFQGRLLRRGVNLLLLQDSDVDGGPLAVPVELASRRGRGSRGRNQRTVRGDGARGVAAVLHVGSSRSRATLPARRDNVGLVLCRTQRPLSSAASFTASVATVSSCMARVAASIRTRT